MIITVLLSTSIFCISVESTHSNKKKQADILCNS